MYAGPRAARRRRRHGRARRRRGREPGRHRRPSPPLDDDAPGDPTCSARCATAVEAANDHLREMVAADAALEGMGTTLTALLWVGQPARPGAHRRLPRLPAARRRRCTRSPTTTPSCRTSSTRAGSRPEEATTPPAALLDHPGARRPRRASSSTCRCARRGPATATCSAATGCPASSARRRIARDAGRRRRRPGGVRPARRPRAARRRARQHHRASSPTSSTTTPPCDARRSSVERRPTGRRRAATPRQPRGRAAAIGGAAREAAPTTDRGTRDDDEPGPRRAPDADRGHDGRAAGRARAACSPSLGPRRRSSSCSAPSAAFALHPRPSTSSGGRRGPTVAVFRGVSGSVARRRPVQRGRRATDLPRQRAARLRAASGSRQRHPRRRAATTPSASSPLLRPRGVPRHDATPTGHRAGTGTRSAPRPSAVAPRARARTAHGVAHAQPPRRR